MNTVTELTAALASWLKQGGVDALTAWPEAPRLRSGGAVTAVSLRGLKSGPPGYQDYLGERFNEDTGEWEELYGKQVELTFGLDVYASTAAEAASAVERLGGLLGSAGPAGMVPVGFSAGETAYQNESRRYFCPAQAGFRVWAAATAREGEAFLDFQIKGENEP